MKILIYSYRKDEEEAIKKFGEKYNVELQLCKEAPSIENAELARGAACISVITTNVTAELIEKFQEVGVRYISTRTIGYEHIDIKKAKELGISVGNVTYSPESVAEYTIMMMIMITRKMQLIMNRSISQDYSLNKVRGKELSSMTVGVIGTGRIGETVIEHLSGFGSKILAYDLCKKEKLIGKAEYVDLEKLIENSDIITLHIPALKDNIHIINKDIINKMKPDVYIINTSRGSLINTEDLIDGIESGKIAGAALDVIENEEDIYYKDLKGKVIVNRNLSILRAFPNVIITPHTAFYTNEAVSDMIENSIKSCILFYEGKNNPWKII